ncbi:unnamed protein product [Ilex paraguariensis]|uniref:Uncharacterized protein n=1 Tax=Ilex paraguariensis TaxID=185542 RepID=A0ABC8RH87_9AQUA
MRRRSMNISMREMAVRSLGEPDPSDPTEPRVKPSKTKGKAVAGDVGSCRGNVVDPGDAKVIKVRSSAAFSMGNPGVEESASMVDSLGDAKSLGDARGAEHDTTERGDDTCDALGGTSGPSNASSYMKYSGNNVEDDALYLAQVGGASYRKGDPLRHMQEDSASRWEGSTPGIGLDGDSSMAGFGIAPSADPGLDGLDSGSRGHH